METNKLIRSENDPNIELIIDQVNAQPPTLDARLLVDAAQARTTSLGYDAPNHSASDSPTKASWDNTPPEAQRESGDIESDLLSTGALNLGMDETRLHQLIAEISQPRKTDDAVQHISFIDEACAEALQGVFSVRDSDGGLMITGVDLRQYRKQTGTNDLVVIIPAYVDDTPVVRIGEEAFSRSKVRAAHVSALIIPSTVTRIDDRALSHIAADHIHIGAGVTHLGAQPFDMSTTSPRSRVRTYSVDSANPCYKAIDRSIYSHDETTLLSAHAPNEAEEIIPAGIEVIESAAWCAGCKPPAVVRCPDSLQRVDSTEWDDALWIGAENVNFRRTFAVRDVRLASPAAQQIDGVWYDFDENEAHIVCGPPAPQSASQIFANAAARKLAGIDDEKHPRAFAAPDLLAPPAQIDGKPLTHIAHHALTYAPRTVVLPATLKSLGEENACLGTQRLTLPEGLEHIGAHCFRSRTLEGIVTIPQSVRRIGTGAFEYAVCRFAQSGAIVHIPSDQLLNCFIDDGSTPEGHAPFDFTRYDQILEQRKNIPDRIGALIHRIATPYLLSESTKDALVAQLKSYGDEALVRIATEGNLEYVAKLYEAGFIDEAVFDRQIELLRQRNRADCVLYLMGKHAEDAPEAQSTQDRFAL